MSNETEKNLFYENKNQYSSLSETDKKNMAAYSSEYRSFLDMSKTEREFAVNAQKYLETNGFVPLSSKDSLKAGDKVYTVNRGKGIIAAVIGSEDITNGTSIVGAHIDSPRLDLKPNPLYEDSHFAYFKTHYYGGIKKYQWTTIPLALHGVATLQDGTQIQISIGEEDDDPTFVISDLLPHFAKDQMQKKLAEAIPGESLNIILGNIEGKDCGEDVKEKVKYNILNLLNEKYDICEEDFISSEIEAVPAYKARDLGFDRSMVAGYGQDDRVCAYTSLLAMLEMEAPKRTACCLLVDKEEIGSVGATGMQSRFFENATAELLDAMGCYSDLKLRRALKNSSMLSSDVSAAYDPAYGDAFEKKNAAYFGRGIVLNKFTGARGKSGSNDANAEYVARVRNIFDSHEIAFQTAELGKVDVGGGGTIAYIAALYGMEVIDSGVAVLSMHAPWEITSKADVYEAKKAYKAFLLDA